MQNQNNNHHIPLIASILTVLVGIGVMGQMAIGGAFALEPPVIPPAITVPASGDFLAVAKPTTVTTRFVTTNFGQGANQVFIRYQLNPIPKPGESVSSQVRYIGDTAPFTMTNGSVNFTWPRAGFWNGLGNSSPWIGDAKLTGYLYIVGDTDSLTSWQSQQFEIGKSMAIALPEAEPIDYFWGEVNKTISVDYKGDATQLQGSLIKGGSASNPFTPIPVFTNCAVPATGPASCTFNLPNKPAGAVDGAGYRILVEEVDSIYGDPTLASYSVVMHTATTDLSFDKTQGIHGFVFNPLSGPANTQTNVSVWVKYDNSATSPISANTVSLTGTGGFEIALPGTPNIDVKLPAMNPGDIKLVSLGSFNRVSAWEPGGNPFSAIWQFSLEVDSTHIVYEIDEANNLYKGITGDTANPSFDIGEYGVFAYASTSKGGVVDNNFQTGDVITASIKLTSLFGTESTLPDKIRRGHLVLHYTNENTVPILQMVANSLHTPEAGVTVLANPNSPEGTLEIDFTIDPNQYPVTDDEFVLFTVDFRAQTAGNTTIDLLNDPTGKVLLSADDASDIWGNVLQDNLDVNSIVIQGIVKPLSGTYFSKKFSVPTDATERFTSWTTFTGVYNAPVNNSDIQTDTKFAIGLFKNNINVCTTYATQCSNDSRFESGFYKIDALSHYNDTNNSSQVSMAELNDISWLKDSSGVFRFDAVQIRIYMSTSDYNLMDPDDMTQRHPGQPWVESVQLTYNADQLGIVGLVTGDSQVTVTRGQTSPYTFSINRTPDSGFTGIVTWSILPAGGSQGVTFDQTTGTVDFTAGMVGNSIAVPVHVLADATAQSTVFSIEATPRDETGKTFAPLSPLNVMVMGAAPYTLVITPVASSVAQSGTVVFTVSLFHAYTQDVSLDDNIAEIFGDDITSVAYAPVDKTIQTETNNSVTITLTAAASNTESTARAFTVTGTSGTDSGAVSATLTITAAGTTKTISLVLTAPIEGVADTGNLQPVFTLRLYDNVTNAKTFELATIHTVADHATVSVPNVPLGAVYKGFLRTTRHLWRQSTANITIGSADSYNMTFTKLLSGDLSTDNSVNSADYPAFVHDYGKSEGGLIPDFNGDGSVNSGDWIYILQNWFKIGSPCPPANASCQ